MIVKLATVSARVLFYQLQKIDLTFVRPLSIRSLFNAFRLYEYFHSRIAMNSVYLLSQLKHKRAHTYHDIECAEPIQRISAACKQYATKCQTRRMNETETVNAMFDSRNDHYHRDDQHYSHHHHRHHYCHGVTTTTNSSSNSDNICD